MNNIVVSVIMPVYNHSAYIRKAIESVLEQKNNFNFELIIGDDCSSDNSSEIISEYSNNYSFIVPIIRERNLGPSKNILDLISRAKGKYICFLEGDDYWIAPDKMKKQVNWLDSHPDQESVAARYVISDENGQQLRKSIYNEVELITNKNFTNKSMPHIGTLMIKNPLQKIDRKRKFYDLISLHNFIADYSIYLYMIDCSDFFVLPDNVLNYRLVAKLGAKNYNSLLKYSMNRYDTLVKRIEYEQKLNKFHFKRIKLQFGFYRWAKEFCAILLFDHGKNRKYGKNVFKLKIWPFLSTKEKILLPIGIIIIYFSAFLKKLKRYMLNIYC